jgi:extracellular factor (EF) 3-hydroxypalmitic acid methyl ester biosynthesis protein
MSGWGLEFLTERDRALLEEAARKVPYAAGEVILRQGARRRELYLLHTGFVRVTRRREGREITVAQLGPGGLFGEMSLLEDTGATASVIAEEDVEVAVVSESHLLELMASEPGFSARFYHSLAGELARRLRATTERVLELTGPETGRRSHAPRTGMVTERQIPHQLVNELAEVRAAMWRIEVGARSGSLGEDEARGRVAASCEMIIRLLAEHTHQDQLVESAWNDLLAFRETEQVETGVGAHIFRETFSLWMTSAVMARCYTRAAAGAADLETLEAIFRNEPQGDGTLGPLIDEWFLRRPVCAAKRSTRRWMVDRLATRAAEPQGLRATALGAEAGLILVDWLATSGITPLSVTVVDGDQRALLGLAERLEAQGGAARVNLVQAPIRELTRGGVEFSQPDQTLICAVGLFDDSSDVELTGALEWAHAQLAPGGELCWSCPADSHPDRPLLQHLLEWRLTYRTRERLDELIEGTPFAGSSQVRDDGGGAGHLVVSVRR